MSTTDTGQIWVCLSLRITLYKEGKTNDTREDDSKWNSVLNNAWRDKKSLFFQQMFIESLLCAWHYGHKVEKV